MEIINTTPFQFAPLVGRMNFPAHSITLIIKGTFNLKHNGIAEKSEKQLYPTGDEFYPNSESQENIYYESDFSYFKPNADLLLVGKCYTPQGIPQKSCAVTFQVGNKKSILAVFGDRYWHSIVKTISSPEPFTVMDISYEKSFGGTGYEKNPIGVGYTAQRDSSGKEITRLPNVESPHQLINSPNSHPEPAGFGPLNRMWQQRFSEMGTYTGGWLKQRWPWFPVDFNWSYYNAAQKHMQVNNYLKGDEELSFINLHPEIPEYHSQLPGLRIRCFLNRLNSAKNDEFDFFEVKMNLDTLWVDMEEEQLVLVWRGLNKIQTEDYDELKHLFIVSEQIQAPPRTVGDFQHDFLATFVEEEADFEEELPQNMSSGPNISINEEIRLAELEVIKAEAALEKELKEAGIETLADIPEPSKEDKEIEARILAEHGLDENMPSETLSRESMIRRLRNNESFAEEDFSNLDLSGLDLSKGDFRGAIFSGVSLKEVNFNEAILTEANFENADLTRASLIKAEATNADFTQACLESADLNEAILNDTIFEKSILTEAIFDNAQSQDGYFSEADLSDASFKNGLFDGADFSDALLNNANFHKSSLKESTLNGAKGKNVIMSECDLTETRASEGCCLINANFRNIKANDSTWENAELIDSDFTYSDMEASDFTSAILKRVKFMGADLKYAKFSKANLTSASCMNMNLFESSFEHANLAKTNFTGSNLYGAEFLEAKIDNTIFQSANLKMTKLAGK